LGTRAGGERSAPGELTAVVGDVREVEIHRLAQPLTQPQAGAIRPPVQGVVIVQDDLGPRVLTLGVRGQEHP
jgi:hypothetical protein